MVHWRLFFVAGQAFWVEKGGGGSSLDEATCRESDFLLGSLALDIFGTNCDSALYQGPSSAKTVSQMHSNVEHVNIASHFTSSNSEASSSALVRTKPTFIFQSRPRLKI